MIIFNGKQRDILINEYENRLEDQQNEYELRLEEERAEKAKTESDSDLKSVLLWGLCEETGRYGGAELRRLAERIMFLCALQFQENEVADEDFNVLELLDSLVKERREEADARGITLRGVVKSIRDTKVTMKKEGLAEALRILISEALRAASEGASVMLSCEQIDARADEEVTYCFSVRDNGDGMEEGSEEKYFEPFGEVRGQERPSCRVELALLERLCRLIHADIGVDRGEDGCTVFSVVIGGKKN